MAFLDKIFRWGKKPFKQDARTDSGPKKGEVAESKSEAASSTAVSDKESGLFANVLIRPHASEKAVASGTLNQYIFEVALRASKPEVALAIKDLYGIAPIAVNIVKIDGKQVRFGKSLGKTKEWKKAIVALPAGKTIDVYKK